MQKKYKTVLRTAVVEYEEKKSKFIASVKPVSAEEDAVGFVDALRTKYWDASHHVYAYSIGGNNIVQRFSDDGEPSGTAGMPVLEVIKRMGVQNAAVVVTRYFGGTLLGASGLIRAYSKSASMAVEAGGIISRLLCVEASVMVEYTLFGKVQNLLLSREYAVKNVIYGQDVEIIVYVPVEGTDSFMEEMIEATNARAIVEMGGKTYIALDTDGKLIQEV